MEEYQYWIELGDHGFAGDKQIGLCLSTYLCQELTIQSESAEQEALFKTLANSNLASFWLKMSWQANAREMEVEVSTSVEAASIFVLPCGM